MPLFFLYTIADGTQIFYREAVIWKNLTHPNILPFLGVTIDPLQLVSEWMPGGTLLKYVKNNPDADRLGLVGISLDVSFPYSYRPPAI